MDPVRMRWYAHHRAVRFSRRCLRMPVPIIQAIGSPVVALAVAPAGDA
jgi:hypothetical protein